VVTAENERKRTRSADLRHEVLDRAVRGERIGGNDGCVPEIEHLELLAPVHAGLQMRAADARLETDRARAVARPRPIRGQFVGRRPEHRDVTALELGGILGVGETRKADESRVIGRAVHSALSPPPVRIEPHRAHTSRSSRM
jgi:hypothetical protein